MDRLEWGLLMEVIVIIGLVVVAIIWATSAAAAAKRKRLFAKYGDAQIVERIMRKMVWQGMNREQLIDSWGRPADVDEKVYKTKTVHVFKYNPDGRRSFRNRVTIENGEVVGWTQR